MLEDVNPHLALWKSETAVSPEEVAFAHWLGNLEHEIGHDMDGDQDVDGYSIDLANTFFIDELTVEEAVAEFTILKKEVTPSPDVQILFSHSTVDWMNRFRL